MGLSRCGCLGETVTVPFWVTVLRPDQLEDALWNKYRKLLVGILAYLGYKVEAQITKNKMLRGLFAPFAPWSLGPWSWLLGPLDP